MILTNEIYLCGIVVEFHWLISLECIPIPTEICCNVPIEIYWNYKQHNTVWKDSRCDPGATMHLFTNDNATCIIAVYLYYFCIDIPF